MPSQETPLQCQALEQVQGLVELIIALGELFFRGVRIVRIALRRRCRGRGGLVAVLEVAREIGLPDLVGGLVGDRELSACRWRYPG